MSRAKKDMGESKDMFHVGGQHPSVVLNRSSYRDISRCLRPRYALPILPELTLGHASRPSGPPAVKSLKDTHSVQIKVVVVHGGFLATITTTIKTVQL